MKPINKANETSTPTTVLGKGGRRKPKKVDSKDKGENKNNKITKKYTKE